MQDGETMAACPACGSTRTELVLELPPVPIHVGLLWSSADDAADCPKGDMRLALCDSCGYVWNTAFQLADTHYEQDYDNSLHHSPKFAVWERALAQSLVERHDLHDRRLAEIGCGDGRFLAQLCLLGDNTGIGFEPGFNQDRASDLIDGADVRVIADFAEADSLRGSDVDFVVARHLLEHLPQPTMLVDTIRNGVAPGAGLYVEVPNFAWALRRGAFEDLMYEHCGYYTPGTLAHLFARHGFADVRPASTFDDLFASVEAIAGEPADVASSELIAPPVVNELRRGIGALEQRIGDVGAEFSALREAGQRVVAWGGGARAVGLLNLVPGAEVVEMVVDVNPRKQNTYVTGTGHPIVAPHELRSADPDVIVVVNPVYLDEIGAMLHDLDVDAKLTTI